MPKLLSISKVKLALRAELEDAEYQNAVQLIELAQSEGYELTERLIYELCTEAREVTKRNTAVPKESSEKLVYKGRRYRNPRTITQQERRLSRFKNLFTEVKARAEDAGISLCAEDLNKLKREGWRLVVSYESKTGKRTELGHILSLLPKSVAVQLGRVKEPYYGVAKKRIKFRGPRAKETKPNLRKKTRVKFHF